MSHGVNKLKVASLSMKLPKAAARLRSFEIVPGALSRRGLEKSFAPLSRQHLFFFAQTVEQATLSMNSLVVTLKNCPKLAFRSLFFDDLCAS